MRKAKRFLELLTEKVPPDAGTKHNLTLSDDGRLQIIIIQGGRFQPLLFNEEDLDLDVETAVNDVVEVWQEAAKRRRDT